MRTCVFGRKTASVAQLFENGLVRTGKPIWLRQDRFDYLEETLGVQFVEIRVDGELHEAEYGSGICMRIGVDDR